MLVAIFAVLNSNVVLIKLYWIDYELSQSLVILLSAFLGALTATFIGFFSKIKSALKIRELNFAVKILEEKIIELNNQSPLIKNSDSNILLKDTETVTDTDTEQK